MWEELAELAAERGGQCVVVRQDHRGPLDALDYVCNGRRLSGSRHSEQRLVREALVESFDELLDRLRLIAGWLIRRFEFERDLFHAAVFQCVPFQCVSDARLAASRPRER